MLKPRLKGKWFRDSIWTTDLKWSWNGKSWFHNPQMAIDDFVSHRLAEI